MYKKLLAKVTATAMVITMVATFGFTSFAAGEESIESSVSENAIIPEKNMAYYSTNEDDHKVIEGDVVVEAHSEYNGYPTDGYYAVEAVGDGEVKVNGSVEGKTEAYYGGTVEVTGDVTSNGHESLLDSTDLMIGTDPRNGLVTAADEESSVKVGGNVDGSRIITKSEEIYGSPITHYVDGKPTTITEYDTRTITGGASAGVYVAEGADVDVEGNVVGGRTGAYVRGESTLTVGGNVVSNGQETIESGTEYVNGEGASFTRHVEIIDGEEVVTYTVDEGSTGVPAVNQKSFDSHGIYTDGNGKIVVERDVTGQQYGITIDNDEDGKAGSIVVLGTIKGEKYGLNLAGANSMYKYVEDNSTGESYAVRAQKGGEKLANEIPDITVYAIEGSDKAINDGTLGEQNGRKMVVECYQAYQAAYESIVNAINYIIKQDDKSNSDYGITVDATKQTINDKEYFTTKINQAFSVAAKLPEGYTISGGENVTVVDNGNGTFSLTLNNVKGGINLKAVLRPVSTGDNSSSGGNDYEVVVEEVTQTAPTPTQPGALVITSTSGQANAASNPEQAALVAAISGDKPAQTISFSVGKVTPQQYKEAVISNVASVPANGALNLVTDKPSVIDYKMVEALSARSDIDVNVVFNYGGKRYKVVIPAGYDMKSLLDKNGYCGFLRLLAVLGGETI
ncbi:hypothetical protein [Butyrivibrio sp.]|uniref:hypothetical protein n=1 Tax=Butyrivibrio sp. TaxID=28121 RepID=UPI0025C3AF20|nr:hypothetical protein [Butyrivibrio sp.]MBQ9301947.1 hypothetical protein [Butyrivibrio sp.]